MKKKNKTTKKAAKKVKKQKTAKVKSFFTKEEADRLITEIDAI